MTMMMTNNRKHNLGLWKKMITTTEYCRTCMMMPRTNQTAAVTALTTTTTSGSQQQQQRVLFGTTPYNQFPMKVGTEFKSLAIFKGQDPPRVLERSEYPRWVNELTKPKPSLAVLRRIPNEEAEHGQILRFLKLTRRQAIRQRNEEKAA